MYTFVKNSFRSLVLFALFSLAVSANAGVCSWLLTNVSKSKVIVQLKNVVTKNNFLDWKAHLKHKIDNLPDNFKIRIREHIENEGLTREQIVAMHDKLVEKFKYAGYFNSAYLPTIYWLRTVGEENFFTLHTSNFSIGLPIILLSHNMLASLAPNFRKTVAYSIYSAFGLSSLYYETPLLGYRTDYDFNDLRVSAVTAIIAYGLQVINERKIKKELRDRTGT